MTPEERRRILLAPIALPITHGSSGKSHAGTSTDKVVFDGDRGFIQRHREKWTQIIKYDGLKSYEEE